MAYFSDTVTFNTSHEVLYRSKDENLVDFSKESGPGGEVFFDVGSLVSWRLSINRYFFSLFTILFYERKPNLLSEDGTTSLSVMAFSKCGKYFAYSVSVAVRNFNLFIVWLSS